MKTAIRVYNLTPAEEQAIIAYLQGDIALRQLGELVGKTHQGASNVVTGVCRQWVHEGKLVIKEDAK